MFQLQDVTIFRELESLQIYVSYIVKCKNVHVGVYISAVSVLWCESLITGVPISP